MDSSDLRAGLSEEQLELLVALDRLFLERIEWASQRDDRGGVADITDDLAGEEPAAHRSR
jgi:hypothetical protein